ncbi:MAG: signal peptide peptidase SppA [Proteobacteria bacterium]|nr:signal peptide peptidase SppA [Pseudomonadota bacterium]
MSTPSRPSFLRRWLGALWRFLDASRRVTVNLIFLLIVVVLVLGLVRRGGPALEDRTALVLRLEGPIVEQSSAGLRESALARARGEEMSSMQLRDLLGVIDTATKDAKISGLVLLPDDLGAAGLPMLREVAGALDRFRAAGKPVIAWANSYDQRQYYLATHADQVLLHPDGEVLIQGYGGYRNYYRDALDKLGVTVNLLRVGTYKSFGEPYIDNGPSPAAKEADGLLYSGLWATYTGDVEKARKLPAGTIADLIEHLPERFAAVGGDAGKLSLEARLVDGLKTQDELDAIMIQRGAKSADGKTFRQVSFEDYSARLAPKLTGDAIGVVVAEGEITDGAAPPGTVGGRSTAELIRHAREDDQIKAIVLRVDSPGGSAFGAELVRHELELTRKAGKPVVVSMSNVAASGGYWISTAADEVIADPATITGSIGVFAMFPTVDKTLDKLGVHTAGTTTTWLAGAGDPRLPPDPRFLQIVQQSIDHTYLDFTTKVATARKTTQPAIDAVAQGRVWTGAQAKERGLVDTLGGLGDALKSAARRAKLGDDYRVAYIERQPGRLEQLAAMFVGTAADVVGAKVRAELLPPAMPAQVATGLERDLRQLQSLVDPQRPYNVVVHCLCEAP